MAYRRSCGVWFILMEALAKVRSSPVTRTLSRLFFSTDRSLVCLFEPTKSSTMHEIVRATFPPAFSLCGGWLGKEHRQWFLCVKVLWAPLRGLLFFSWGDVNIRNFLQNPDFGSAGGFSPIWLTQPGVAGQRKHRIVTFNPCQPFPHTLKSPVWSVSFPSPLICRHLFHSNFVFGPVQFVWSWLALPAPSRPRWSSIGCGNRLPLRRVALSRLVWTRVCSGRDWQNQRNEDRSPPTRSQDIRTSKKKKKTWKAESHRKSLLISAQTINRSGRWEGFMLHLLVWWNVSQRFGWAELRS